METVERQTLQSSQLEQSRRSRSKSIPNEFTAPILEKIFGDFFAAKQDFETLERAKLAREIGQFIVSDIAFTCL